MGDILWAYNDCMVAGVFQFGKKMMMEVALYDFGVFCIFLLFLKVVC